MTSFKLAVSDISALIAVKLTHMQALAIFALVISVAFGFLGRRQPQHYGTLLQPVTEKETHR